MIQHVICVRHRDGTCATQRQSLPNRIPDNQPTLCRHVVVLPGGYHWGFPTCPECLDKLLEKTDG